MQPDPCGGLLVALLFLLVGLKFILGNSGIFRGCAEGWWAAVWNRVLVGPRQPGNMNPLGCLLLVLLALLSMGCLGSILSLLLGGIAGSMPAK